LEVAPHGGIDLDKLQLSIEAEVVKRREETKKEKSEEKQKEEEEEKEKEEEDVLDEDEYFISDLVTSILQTLRT